MKLLTLNTHSLVEENYNKKLMDFVTAVAGEMPQVIALQEVNQTCCEAVVPKEKLTGFCPCNQNTIVRADNHIYNAVKLLRERGIKYYWTWLPLKKGYDKYDEGIALMSLSPIIKTDVINISNIDDYNNWKTRKILGICTEEFPEEWFFSVHFGWWDDKDEPFKEQWERVDSYMKKYDTVWLMGDFNSPSEVRDEGYDMVESSKWYDTYFLAFEKDNGITVGHVIDGWKDKIVYTGGMRMDHIWCNKKVRVQSSDVVFNGINYPMVSDHYGVMVCK